MRHKLKLYLLLEILILLSFVFVISVGAEAPTEINFDVSAENNNSAVATLKEIGENKYSLTLSGDGWIDFSIAPFSEYSPFITVFVAETEVSNLPYAAFLGLDSLTRLEIRGKNTQLPTELANLRLPEIYIHRLSSANSLFLNYGESITYICEFSNGVCNTCGFSCTSHLGGESTCLKGAVCDRCGMEYGEKLTTHTGGVATCKEKAKCDICGTEYGELSENHTGGVATCKEKAKCELCGTEYGELSENHTGGVATCKEKAKCELCGTEYGELSENHTGGVATCKERAKCELCGNEYGVLLTTHKGGCATCEDLPICEICGTSYGSPSGHSLSFVPYIQPTCLGYGTVAHYHCGSCGRNFDGNGKEILDIYIEAEGHTGGEATCISKAVCKVCGVPYGKTNPENHSFSEGYDASSHFELCPCGKKINSSAHSFTAEIIKEADENEDGIKEYSCQCGYSYTEAIPRIEGGSDVQNPENSGDQTNQTTDRKEKEDLSVLKAVLYFCLPCVSISVVFCCISFIKRRKMPKA